MWDEVYSNEEYAYGESPNDFLFEMTARLKSGKTLCLAEGEGRNAVYLAKHRFSPTAVDSSKVGLAKAEKLAQKRGVTLETIHADLADFTIEENSWDSVISIFCHLPPNLRKKIHRSIVAGLKPRGTVLLEAYSPKQLEYKTGGPPNAELLMELEELKKEFEGLDFLHAKEVVRDVVEGTKHTGKASVVQILAKKV